MRDCADDDFLYQRLGVFEQDHCFIELTPRCRRAELWEAIEEDRAARRDWLLLNPKWFRRPKGETIAEYLAATREANARIDRAEATLRALLGMEGEQS